MGKCTQIKESVYEFSENSTLHGLPQIYRPNTKHFRIIWIIAFLTCTVIGMMQMVRFFYRFATKPVDIDREIYYQPLKFPAVTICNQNGIQKSKLELGGEELVSAVKSLSHKESRRKRELKRPEKELQPYISNNKEETIKTTNSHFSITQYLKPRRYIGGKRIVTTKSRPKRAGSPCTHEINCGSGRFFCELADSFNPRTPSEAREFCETLEHPTETRNMTLAIIDTQSDFDCVKDAINGYYALNLFPKWFHIGIHRANVYSWSWYWFDGGRDTLWWWAAFEPTPFVDMYAAGAYGTAVPINVLVGMHSDEKLDNLICSTHEKPLVPAVADENTTAASDTTTMMIEQPSTFAMSSTQSTTDKLISSSISPELSTKSTSAEVSSKYPSSPELSSISTSTELSSASTELPSQSTTSIEFQIQSTTVIELPSQSTTSTELSSQSTTLTKLPSQSTSIELSSKSTTVIDLSPHSTELSTATDLPSQSTISNELSSQTTSQSTVTKEMYLHTTTTEAPSQFRISTDTSTNSLTTSALEAESLQSTSSEQSKYTASTYTQESLTRTIPSSEMRLKVSSSSSLFTDYSSSDTSKFHEDLTLKSTVSSMNPTTSIQISSSTQRYQNDLQSSNPTDASDDPFIPEVDTEGKPWTVPNPDQPSIALQVHEKIPRILAKIPPSTRKGMGQSLDDLVEDCTWDGQHCLLKEFNNFQHMTFGNCYTFNGGNRTALVATRPGQYRGLNLLININQSQYIGVLAPTAGVRLLVHRQDVHPFVEDEGIDIGVGELSTVKIRNENSSLYVPYRHCEINERPTLYEGTYTYRACIKSCLQKEKLNICGCADPHLPFTEKDNICLAQDESCSAQLDQMLESLDCNCPQRCRDSQFPISVSKSRWPSAAYEKVVSEALLEKNPSLFPLLNESDGLRRNFLKIVVYYDYMKISSSKEKPAYLFSKCLADVGGFLGITIGMSFISVAEVFHLVGSLLQILFMKSIPVGSVDNDPRPTTSQDIRIDDMDDV